MGREHKGILSVTGRLSLNNKHINQTVMFSHTSIHARKGEAKDLSTMVNLRQNTQ